MLLVVAMMAAADGAERSPVVGKAVSHASLDCEIVNAVDGDTIDIALPVKLELPTAEGGKLPVKQIIVRVRLMAADDVGCWAPETHRQSSIGDPVEREAEYERGLAAKRHLQQYIGRKAKLVISTKGNRLIDYMTLERLLGVVTVDGKSLGALQVQTKHAATTKGGKLGK